MSDVLDDSQTDTTESLFELLDADALLIRATFDQSQDLFENHKHRNKHGRKTRHSMSASGEKVE